MLLSQQHLYPEYYTLEREEYDLCELEALGSLAIKLNVHSFPGIKRTFEDLLGLVGTKNFVYKYAKVYQLLLNLWNSSGRGLEEGGNTGFGFWMSHEHDKIDTRLLTQLLVEESERDAEGEDKNIQGIDQAASLGTRSKATPQSIRTAAALGVTPGESTEKIRQHLNISASPLTKKTGTPESNYLRSEARFQTNGGCWRWGSLNSR